MQRASGAEIVKYNSNSATKRSRRNGILFLLPAFCFLSMVVAGTGVGVSFAQFVLLLRIRRSGPKAEDTAMKYRHQHAKSTNTNANRPHILCADAGRKSRAAGYKEKVPSILVEKTEKHSTIHSFYQCDVLQAILVQYSPLCTSLRLASLSRS